MPELIRGSSVLLTGADVVYAADVFASACRDRAGRNGGVPPRMQHITKILQAAALQYRVDLLASSGGGTDQFRSAPGEAPCDQSTTWLTVEATAERLGVSTGFTRRLCREGTLRSVKASGNAWMVDEVAVLERLGERNDEAA